MHKSKSSSLGKRYEVQDFWNCVSSVVSPIEEIDEKFLDLSYSEDRKKCRNNLIGLHL
jgi:hypothetical protein